MGEEPDDKVLMVLLGVMIFVMVFVGLGFALSQAL